MIERRARRTNALGPQTLWEGYGELSATRLPDGVRTTEALGCLYARLVEWTRPAVVVEVGTAFGVSGMYWLAGLERTGSGVLVTYEPNAAWREIALKNLSAVGERYVSILDKFEEGLAHLPGPIDIAFLDGIHTDEFVSPQLEICFERASRGALILIDDIDFSADMKRGWQRWSQDERVVASVELGTRVGMLELASGAEMSVNSVSMDPRSRTA
jgi:predicted O-methyltransferase YrrM